VAGTTHAQPAASIEASIAASSANCVCVLTPFYVSPEHRYQLAVSVYDGVFRGKNDSETESR